MLTSTLISNLLVGSLQAVCKFPSAFLPGEKYQRKSGAFLNQLIKA